jgi:hypothetical protein
MLAGTAGNQGQTIDPLVHRDDEQVEVNLYETSRSSTSTTVPYRYSVDDVSRSLRMESAPI